MSVQTEPGRVDVTSVALLAERLQLSLERVISGKQTAIESAVVTVLAGGHLLLEDVPGVGKTTLASALARSMNAQSRRIQFTSDLLPTDVTGVSIYDQESLAFAFHPGPVFSHIVIADEVNRATPKTQSALLEAMGERSVTVDGHTHRLPELFVVIATQNPHDMEGTFPLPEAQRDRFMTRISLGYPDAESELAMVFARGTTDPLHDLESVATVDDVLEAQRAIARVHLNEEVGRYLVRLVDGTRTHPGLSLGASPRATLHLTRMSRARAAASGRSFVSPDDVAVLAQPVLAHRLVPRGHLASVNEATDTASSILAEIVAQTDVG